MANWKLFKDQHGRDMWLNLDFACQIVAKDYDAYGALIGFPSTSGVHFVEVKDELNTITEKLRADYRTS